jgi:hypothetical protein
MHERTGVDPSSMLVLKVSGFGARTAFTKFA